MASQKSKTATTKCQATHPETNKRVCNRSIWNRDEKRCIFHSSEKPAHSFKVRFLIELKHVNLTDSIEFFDGRCFIFPQNIKLEELSFEKPVIFDYAKFGDNISFMYAQFGDKASFRDAQFDKADFISAQFGDKANFEAAKFGDGETRSKRANASSTCPSSALSCVQAMQLRRCAAICTRFNAESSLSL